MENQTWLTPRQTATSTIIWTSTSALPRSTALGDSNLSNLLVRIAKYVLYTIILVLSIVGNTAVVHIIRSRRRTRKTSYILLVLNLALCDVITPSLSIPFDWAYEEFGDRWVFGRALCKLVWPFQTLFSTSSALILAMICYDRYRAVVRPFKALRITKTQIKRCIFAIHFTSFLFTLPYAVVLRLEGDQCNENWPSPVSYYRKAYTLVLFLVQYGIPLVLMVILHSLAVKTLCAQFQDSELHVLRDRSAKSVISRKGTLSNVSLSSRHSFNRLFVRTKKQSIRVTKMFVLVMMVFALSMLPNQVLWLWVDFGQGADNDYFSLISVVCRLFTYSNSVLNPIIYGFFSREFRSKGTKLKRAIPKEKAAANKDSVLKLSLELKAVKRFQLEENEEAKVSGACFRSIHLLNRQVPNKKKKETIYL